MTRRLSGNACTVPGRTVYAYLDPWVRKHPHGGIIPHATIAGHCGSGDHAEPLGKWIEIHREKLMADWALAVQGEAVFRIEPLR
ncbi:MAG: hypothetical protein ABT940_02400 [Alphaproteobacteria bacterium]